MKISLVDAIDCGAFLPPCFFPSYVLGIWWIDDVLRNLPTPQVRSRFGHTIATFLTPSSHKVPSWIFFLLPNCLHFSMLKISYTTTLVSLCSFFVLLQGFCVSVCRLSELTSRRKEKKFTLNAGEKKILRIF